MTSTGSTPPLLSNITNLRHLAERFSRGVILRRHLPRQFQSLPLYVSPEAGLRYWRWGLKTVDPMLFRMARELVRTGSVVWDQRRLVQFQRSCPGRTKRFCARY